MAKSKANQTQAKNTQQTKLQAGQASANTGSQMTGSQSAVELLKQDHRKVEQLFEQFEQADDQDRQHELAHQICKELMVHAMIEEEIFYPACRSGAGEDEDATDKLDEAQVEHDSAKILINEILRGEPDDEFWKAKVCVLKDQIEHHVEEEEMPNEGVMAKATTEGVDTPDLANRLMRRKNELMSRAGDMRPARAVSLMQPMHHMDQGRRARGGMDVPERDERGRFMSEDDQRGRYAERRGSRYEDEDDRGPRSRYEDEEHGRSHGGWYGDSRGHSEASRRAWEERRGSRYENDDDERRGHGGWSGDSRGHSEAARRGWQHRR